MQRRWFLFIAVAALVAVAAATQDGLKRERNGRGDAVKDQLEGKTPPSLEGQWFNTKGKILNWDGLKGKVVVLDFWTHWSLASRESMPRMRLLLSKFADKGLSIIGVHSDPNQAKMEQSIRQLGITWPVLLDAKKVNMKLFGADSFSDYYVVDRKGILRYADLANDEIEKAVETLLAEQPVMSHP